MMVVFDSLVELFLENSECFERFPEYSEMVANYPRPEEQVGVQLFNDIHVQCLSKNKS